MLVAACFIAWLLLLFYAMSVVAEVFLCPAVQVSLPLASRCSVVAGCDIDLVVPTFEQTSDFEQRSANDVFIGGHSTSQSGCGCQQILRASRC